MDKINFDFFFNDSFMYLKGMGSIQKKTKIPIFSKRKKLSSYHGYFVINKYLKIEK